MLVDEEQGVHIRCRSQLTGRFVRQVCTVGCIACQRCVKVCPTEAIYMENNLAHINYDKCINCRECGCPMNTIEWQEGKPVLSRVAGRKEDFCRESEWKAPRRFWSSWFSA